MRPGISRYYSVSVSLAWPSLPLFFFFLFFFRLLSTGGGILKGLTTRTIIGDTTDRQFLEQ